MNHPFRRLTALILASSLFAQPTFGSYQPAHDVLAVAPAPSSTGHAFFQDQAITASLRLFYAHGMSLQPNIVHAYHRLKIHPAPSGVELWALSVMSVGLFLFVPPLRPLLGLAVLGYIATNPADRPWPIKPGQPGHVTNSGIYNQLLMGVGDMSPDWHRATVVAEEILAEGIKPGQPIPLPKIGSRVSQRLEHQGLGLSDKQHFKRLLEQLVKAGIISHDTAKKKSGYVLESDPAIIATKLKLVGFIAKQLRETFSSDQSRKKAEKSKHLLVRFANIAERWPLSPVESRWAFLQALASLDPEYKARVLRVIQENPDLRAKYPLMDAAWLMLGQPVGDDWLEKHAPALKGRTLYTTAPEGWFAAGGLGRVQQYHSAAMKKLVGASTKVRSIEAYYPDDYDQLEKPEGFRKLDLGPFTVAVPGGGDVEVEVFSYVNKEGVEVFLIKDSMNFYTKRRYSYGKNGSADFVFFSNFFNRATLELIKRLEERNLDSLKATQNSTYKAPVIIANDGQMGQLPDLRYSEKQFQDSAILQDALVWMVTHTYKNRQWLGSSDATSLGVSHADGASAVAAVHRDEVAPKDPFDSVIAITNGDYRRATREVYLRIWRKLFGSADDEHPTRHQIGALKAEAKRLFRMPDEVWAKNGISPDRRQLDPRQPVISYSGRLVDEKAGLKRAFTRRNLEEMLKEGIQVVLYANEQAHTGQMLLELLQVSRELNSAGYPGKLIVRSGWYLPDQRALLTASDAQVQDSDRDNIDGTFVGTEAAGYTEADISAVGGLQIAPPWMEGILQRHGVILDRTVPGSGNVLIPRCETGKDADVAAGYLEVFRWINTHYTGEKPVSLLNAYQAASVRLSQPLEALLPAAEYLRQLSLAVERKENPLEAIRQMISGEPEAARYFRKPWVREGLVRFLAHPRQRGRVLPLVSEGALRAYVVHEPGKHAFVVAVNADPMWYSRPGAEAKKWLRIPFQGNEEAFKILGLDRSQGDVVFQVFDAGEHKSYEIHHRLEDIMGRDGKEGTGWKIGIPYPGIQILTPLVTSTQGLLPQRDARGVPMTWSKPAESQDPTIFLRQVPDIPGLQGVLQKDKNVQAALRYLFEPRFPKSTSGSRMILQVPVRWLGGWTNAFQSRLNALLRALETPAGSVIHLIGAYPTGKVSFAINHLHTRHTFPDHYRIDAEEGHVVVYEAFPGEEGREASMYSPLSLTANVTQVRETMNTLHGLQLKGILDALGHLAADAPMVFQHPEYFKHDFPNRARILTGNLSDQEIIDSTGKNGFMLYLKDTDSRWTTFFSQRSDFVWGAVVEGNVPYVRVIMRHHGSGYGSMHDSVAIDLTNKEARDWYIEELCTLLDQGDADGFRFDLSDQIGDHEWSLIKEALLRRVRQMSIAQGKEKRVIFAHEEYRLSGDKVAVSTRHLQELHSSLHGTNNGSADPIELLEELPLNGNAYYNSDLFNRFRDDRVEAVPDLIRQIMTHLMSGQLINYFANHDEILGMGRLRGSNYQAFLSLVSLVMTLPGFPLFYWPDLYGWRWADQNGVPSDIKRELSYESFIKGAAERRERDVPLIDVLNRIRALNHEILRDSRDMIHIETGHSSVLSFARIHASPSHGREMMVSVSNFSLPGQSVSLRFPLDQISDEGDPFSRSRHYGLYDVIHHRLYFYTGAELENLSQDLASWEDRVYLVREIKNPSTEFIALFDSSWPAQGIYVWDALRDRLPQEPGLPTPPWLLQPLTPRAADSNRRLGQAA